MKENEKLYLILNSILSEYKTITDFSKAASVDRGYLSRFINKKLPSLPSPKILKKIAQASKGITTYEELMGLCDYIPEVNNSLTNAKVFTEIPLFYKLGEYDSYYSNNSSIENAPHNYYTSIFINESADNFFAYKASDGSMAPLLNVDDVAVINRKFEFVQGKVFCIIYDNQILLRKVVKMDDIFELQPLNPYYPVIKAKEEDFEIIGKVIKGDNQSAFM